MLILVINAGSSSLKYQLFDMENESVLAKGNCERIGIDGKITHKQLVKDLEYVAEAKMDNHEQAMKVVIDALMDAEHGCITSMDEIGAIGHRVVHGGPYFFESALVTDEVLEKLNLCYDFAPLHTPAHLMGIAGCTAAMPGKPQVLVFDTAFHQTMPEKAFMYGLPYDIYEKYGVRRYGAHGTSHRFVSGEAIKLLGKPAEDTRIVTCHLGNGSSISAVKGGKCVDTSMGFTPLAGVIMGTRTGDMDPAAATYVMNKTGMSPDEMSEYMNKKSGFLGIGGYADCRELVANAEKGDERATLALSMLSYQVRKFIGSYTVAMGGLDAIVFTAGIGENTVALRKAIIEGLEPFGVKLDNEQNEKGFRQSNVMTLSAEDSKVKVYLIPTNEELVIARDTRDIVSRL